MELDLNLVCRYLDAPPIGEKKEERGVVAVIDSRKVVSPSLFFALPGKQVDGHDFLFDAHRRGAICAVVKDSYCGPDYGLHLIRVEDVRSSLHFLAKKIHAKRSCTVIGVTGTVGKTTTKDFLVTLLGEKFSVASTPGNSNSQLGLPVALLNAPLSSEVFVIEMGMSQRGEISKLCEIAPPDIGVLTHISLVHGENFSKIEEIAEAKSELFQTKQLQMGFFQADTLDFSPISHLSCEKWQYSKGQRKKSHFFSICSNGKTAFSSKGEVSGFFSLPFQEHHFLENIVGAVSVARTLGMNWEEIERGLQKLKPSSHRFEKKEYNGILWIDDSYNASPESVQAALSNLPFSKGKRIAVLGAMKELGSFCLSSHQAIGHLAATCVDYLLCIGQECLPLIEAFWNNGGRKAEFFSCLSILQEKLVSLVEPGDVVLIKGSCSLKLWTLLDQFSSKHSM